MPCPYYGVQLFSIAFQRFQSANGLFGSPFVGMANFRTLFSLPDTWQVIGNNMAYIV
jgi:putative aldouronate transport system permease protein